MIIHPAAQGSAEWLLARATIPTASEFSNLVTPKFELRKWTTEMPNTYLAKKLAEKWLGGPLMGPSSFAMEQGQIIEAECLSSLEFEQGWKIRRVGLVLTDDKTVGCSPDGLIGDDDGIEAKCPAPETHVKYLLDGELPEQYGPQVHGAMYVTGYKKWTFVSYRRRMPPLIVHVPRDEEIQGKIAEAIDQFLIRFAVGWDRLCELNGGPPPQRPQPFPGEEPIRFTWENDPGIGITP